MGCEPSSSARSASMKLAYRSPNFRSSLPSGADAASSTISRTAFSASSARIRNAPSRARSAGISVRASHRPLTCRNRSSCGRMPGSSSSMGIPDGSVMRSSVGPAAARTPNQNRSRRHRPAETVLPLGSAPLFPLRRARNRRLPGHRRAIVAVCQRNPRASQGEIHQRASRISTGRWRRGSARTPNATTGPAPAIPRHWWSRSSPPARDPAYWTSAAGPASPPGNSRRPGAGCSGSTPTPGWLTWPGRAGSRSRWRRSKPGTRQAGHSMRSSPGRPGTGWTRPRERPRRRRCCTRAGGWRCSGTPSSPRPAWVRPSPGSTAGSCPTHPTCGRGPFSTPT